MSVPHTQGDSRRPPTVRAVIEHRGRWLLVQHHYHNPANRGKWSLPGGRIEPGDTDRIATLRRELYEEFRLEVTIVRFVGTYAFRAQQHHVYHVHPHTPQLRIDPSEIAAMQWFTVEEVIAIHDDDRLFASFMLEAIRSASNPTRP